MNVEKLNLVDLGAKIIAPVDVFICSSSYETRCRSVADALDPTTVRRALVLEAMDLENYVAGSAAALVERFAPASSVVQVNTRKPLISADNIAKALFGALANEGTHSILVDVTTFTHEILLIFLRLLRANVDRCNSRDFTFVYTGASEYSVGDAVESKWLSKGVSEVRTVLGYGGASLPTRKTHLIVLVGYEHERASKLIEMLEPNSISLGYGRSGTATTEKDRDSNERYHQLVKRAAASFARVDSFEITCNDPLQTRDAILATAEGAAGSNIVLAPMNNKMSTIGAALAAFKREDIQVCYAPVLSYNVARYSKAGTACYLFDIPEVFEEAQWPLGV
jgi:hypothetical protein